MKQALVAVWLACVLAMVASDCSFARPCEVSAMSRVTCGDRATTKFDCLWIGCCYDDSATQCYHKVPVCDARNKDVSTDCTMTSSTQVCTMEMGQTCGLGTMEESWECDDGSGSLSPVDVLRCCCDTPCPGEKRCDIPPADRIQCLDKTSSPVTTEAFCFIIHCCFDPTQTSVCYEPNVAPETTCGMVTPGCGP